MTDSPTPKSPTSLTRRSFAKSAGAGAAALAFPFVGRWSRAASPNGKLRHACIGCDGQGWADMNDLASHPNIEIVALCDVDTARQARAAAKFPEARRYQDYREMLEKEAGNIDSVNIAVPDHMHAPIAMAAIALGKHVYCQKPLTHTVGEARDLRLAAEKAGIVTQMGNQIQSTADYQIGAELIRTGAVGKVTEIHAWSNARFPQRGRKAGSDPVPESLDWDKWLGVAPERPYLAPNEDGGMSRFYHPFHWRGWIDFGGGPMGDFGCHILDTPFKGTGLKFPTSVRNVELPQEWLDHADWQKENWPDWQVVEFEFPGTEVTAETVKVVWYDGGKQPPREVFQYESDDRRPPGGGSLIVGESGRLLVTHFGVRPQLIPYEANRGLKMPDLQSFSHYHAFIDACLGKGKTGSNFGFAGPMTETVQLGNLASRFPGKKLAWDADKFTFPGEPDADKLLRKEYRKWS
ncbi:MAG: Gfo/Idh/MocA family oxidoreductase [Verrucomicrobiales bacterium]